MGGGGYVQVWICACCAAAAFCLANALYYMCFVCAGCAAAAFCLADALYNIMCVNPFHRDVLSCCSRHVTITIAIWQMLWEWKIETTNCSRTDSVHEQWWFHLSVRLYFTNNNVRSRPTLSCAARYYSNHGGKLLQSNHVITPVYVENEWEFVDRRNTSK